MRLSLDFSAGERRSPYTPKVFAGEQRISLENPSVSLVDSHAWSAIFGNWQSDAGVSVDAKVAMGVPAIWCAVTFLANTLAALPIRLHRKSVNGRETVDTGRLAGLLAGLVNDDYLNSFNWRRDMMTSTLLKGRGLTYIEKAGSGDAANLFPLDMNSTTISRKAGRLNYEYRQTSPSRIFNYGAGEIIDIKMLGALDGVDHFDPIATLKDAIGLMVALRKYGSRFFQNGGVPPLAMEGPAASPTAVTRAKDDVDQAVKNAYASGSNMVYLPLGHKLTPIGFDPEKGQLLAAQRFCVEETSRIYNLPPAFLHNLERATFSNVEQQDLNLVKHCVLHWVEQIEQELNAKLFGSTRNRYIEFDLNGLLRGDLVARMSAYASAVQTGIMMPNEVRRRENLPDAPGGDTLLINTAIQPLIGAAPSPGATGEQDPPNDPADNET